MRNMFKDAMQQTQSMIFAKDYPNMLLQSKSKELK